MANHVRKSLHALIQFSLSKIMIICSIIMDVLSQMSSHIRVRKEFGFNKSTMRGNWSHVESIRVK